MNTKISRQNSHLFCSARLKHTAVADNHDMSIMLTEIMLLASRFDELTILFADKMANGLVTQHVH